MSKPGPRPWCCSPWYSDSTFSRARSPTRKVHTGDRSRRTRGSERRMTTARIDEVKIRTQQLSAWFGKSQALKAVDLDIYGKRVTAVIGPSGCGKSTFVRCLNRMHEVTPAARVEGRVLLDGRDIYEPSSDPVRLRQQVGMVFQRPNPFPTMSIRDNVLAGLNLGGHRPPQADDLVERTLRRVGLWEEVRDVLGQSGSGLSGGQQQRLCIARALAL